MAKHSTLPFEEIVRRSGEIAKTTVLARGTQISYPTRKELPPSLFNDYVPRDPERLSCISLTGDPL